MNPKVCKINKQGQSRKEYIQSQLVHTSVGHCRCRGGCLSRLSDDNCVQLLHPEVKHSIERRSCTQFNKLFRIELRTPAAFSTEWLRAAVTDAPGGLAEYLGRMVHAICGDLCDIPEPTHRP